MQRKMPQNPDMPQEKSYYQMRCEFYEKFKNEIAPKLMPFEKERQVQYNSMKQFLAPAFVMGAFMLWLNFIFLIVFILFIARIYTKTSKAIELRIKTCVMPVVCSVYGDLKWKTGNPIDPVLRGFLPFAAVALSQRKKITSYEQRQLIEASMPDNIPGLDDSYVIHPYKTSNFDDMFEGNYKGVRYKLYETSSDTRGVKKPVFRGAILKIDINKNFKGHIIVCKDTLLHGSPKWDLRHTVLEDVEFEEKFDVFTDDEIEARYLLTTTFMQRLNNLKNVFAADKISCAFYNSELFIALFTKKDLFTITMLDKPVYDFTLYETLHNEIISIYKIIDHFKLNEKTGL